MKIYTKTGDSGTSSLYGGDRISKASARMHAYGTVDELNSMIGVVYAHGVIKFLQQKLSRIQEELLVVGSDLATPVTVHNSLKIVRLNELCVTKLEQEIDKMSLKLPELKHFILPSGSIAGAQLHLARSICRRAERCVVELSAEEEINNLVIVYLNRLSDWLFVSARLQNFSEGNPEREWIN